MNFYSDLIFILTAGTALASNPEQTKKELTFKQD
jgi:hypothetical protein